MANYEQERPLAPEAHRITINHDDDDKKHYRNSCLKCCGCAMVVFGIIGITMLILMLTVFKVKDPTVNLNYVTLKGLESANIFNLLPTTNVTIEADMSIKNPNAAAFEFKNAVTGIYYENVLIGEAKTPKGTAKANKTFRLTITIDVMLQTFLRVPRFLGDLTAGEMPVSTRSSIRGKVEVLNIIKKKVGVKLDCSLTVLLASQNFKDLNCKRSVSI